jgi:hypothetical protein
MDSSAFFSRRNKYCHNGGMAFAPLARQPLSSVAEPHERARPAGSTIGTMAPTTAPLEVADLQEK